MSNTKTIRAWLNTIADKEIREAAIENWENDTFYKAHKDLFVKSVREAIAYGFWWDETPQGYGYWKDVNSNFLNGTLKTINP